MRTAPGTESVQWGRRVAIAAGVLAISVGGGHVLAWVTGLMARVPASTIIMKTNAGLGLSLLGLALVLLANPQPHTLRRRLAEACATLAVLIGLATLTEHIVGLDLGIDELLASEHPGAAATTSPNRLGPPAALWLLLTGTALLLLARSGPRRGRHQPFAVGVAILGLLSIIGYLYDANELFAVARVTGVAWPTAVTFVVLSVGILCARPAEGLMAQVTADDAGGTIVRALLAPIVFLPILFGWIRLTGERAGWFDASMGTALMMLLFIVTYQSLLFFTSRRVSVASEVARASQEAVRQNAEALAARAAELEAVLDSLQDAVFVYDAAGNGVRTNPAALDLYSVDMIGAGVVEKATNNLRIRRLDGSAMPPSEFPSRRALAGERVSREQYLFAGRDGTDRVGEASATPLVVDGKIVGAVAIAHDVTDRRRVEAALRSSEEKFARAFHGNTAAMAITRMRDGLYLEVNDRFFEVTGFSRAEAVGHTTAELNIWKDPADRQAFVRTLQQHGIVRNAECRFVRRNGEEWIAQVSSQVSEIEGERVLISSFSDVTEGKKAEQALRESEARFRSLAEELRTVLDALPVAVFITRDRDARSMEGNRFAEEVLRLPHRSNVSLSAPPAERPATFKAMKGDVEIPPEMLPVQVAALTGQEVRDYELDLAYEDGTRLSLLGNAAPFVDERGNARGAVGAFVDVTLLKQAEEASREANERLQEADQRKDEFLAVLSHELRNPLASIRAALYVLERSVPGGEQANRARTVIGRQIGQLTRLVDDLLDVTRIARGKIELQREPVELAGLVRRTAEDHRALFTAKEMTLDVDVPEGELWVDGDAQRLAQAVGNLLHNAAKFTDRGGTATVRARRDARLSSAVISVRDNGSGISAAALPHLFEPFMQADRTMDRARGGLGLGLSLVRSLAEMHGGTVSAHSEGLGRGAEFEIRLPLRSDPPPAPSPQSVGRHRPRRIFIIEDNVDAAESLRQALELAGHQVEVAYNGVEGIEKARAFKPEIVLCDIGLPGMNGYDVAREFRGDAALRSTHLIALTGYALPEDLVKAREAGFDLHIAKPPDPEALQHALASLGTPPATRQ